MPARRLTRWLARARCSRCGAESELEARKFTARDGPRCPCGGLLLVVNRQSRPVDPAPTLDFGA